MKEFTYESAKEHFDEMMEHALEDKHVVFKSKDGRRYYLRLHQLPSGKKAKAGRLKGKLIVPDDFDDPVPDMAPYMW